MSTAYVTDAVRPRIRGAAGELRRLSASLGALSGTAVWVLFQGMVHFVEDDVCEVSPGRRGATGLR
eukprot:scaffold49188_cov71-Phaeocystis_antarctica.AAC.3